MAPGMLVMSLPCQPVFLENLGAPNIAAFHLHMTALGYDLVSRSRKDVGVSRLISGRMFYAEPLIRTMVTSNVGKFV